MASVVQLPHTGTKISIKEYLQTHYRPDLEFLDGELKAKPLGQYDHSCLQALLASWFTTHRQAWGVVPLTEQRTRVSETRVRLPDLTLVPRGPASQVTVAPPLLAIEILSPDDTYSELERRAWDYAAMGIATVWLIDPETRTGRMIVGHTWTEERRLVVPGTDIYVELDWLFGELDECKVETEPASPIPS
jgi:Uma2 family endonuclease